MLPAGPRSTYPFSSGVQPGSRDLARQILLSINAANAKANEVRTGLMTTGCDGAPVINPLDGTLCNGAGTAGTKVLFNPQTRTVFGTLSNGNGLKSTVTTHPAVRRTPVSAYSVGIAAGPDGNMWFTYQIDPTETGSWTPGVGRITMRGVVTRFTDGLTLSPGSDGGGTICAGDDGNMWFVEGGLGKIGRVTMRGVITEFSSGITDTFASNAGICVGSDGNLWFSEDHKIGKITATGPPGVVTEFTPSLPFTLTNWWITRGSDGRVWFGDYNIFALSPGGVFQEFPLPVGENAICVTLGPGGNIWFASATSYPATSGKIGSITPTGFLTWFNCPDGISAYYLTMGNDGNLWFTQSGTNPIWRMTPSGVFTSFVAGLADGSQPNTLAPGPDGNIWFTDIGVGCIGRLDTKSGEITHFPIAFA